MFKPMKNIRFTSSAPHQRRKFLQQLGTGLATTLTLPALAGATSAAPHSLPLLAPLEDTLDEKYWEMVKQQFMVSPNLIMVNAANLCPSPHFINEQVSAETKDLATDVSFQNRQKFSKKWNEAIASLAQFLGVEETEIGITRNTTESNNTIVNGLDFKPGDEIIIWEQNHPTNSIAWQQRAKRYGFTVKKISLPASPQSADDLVAPFAAAITSNTKMITFSHISNVSGIALPASEICQMARKKGLLTLVDGAQSLGFMDLNLKEMGCDFYTSSTHKWLMGPMENGVLYVKNEHIEKVWPTIVGAGWQESSHSVDEKICMLGQRNDPSIATLPSMLAFHQTIGKKNIEDRVRKLCSYLKEQIQTQLPQAKFVTPMTPELSGGIVILSIPGKQPQEFFQMLYDKHGIACAPTGGLRLSPHIYNTLQDMDKIVAALVSTSA